MTRGAQRAAVVLAAILLLAGPAPVRAQAPPVAAPQKADSPGAARQPTDETGRRAMTSIRALVLEHHTLVTHRRLAPDQARKFADAVRRQVQSLSPPPSGEFAELVAGLTRAADAVAGGNPSLQPIDAIVAMDELLARYSQRFDHPGWQPLR